MFENLKLLMNHSIVSGALSIRFERFSWRSVKEALNRGSRDAKRKSWLNTFNISSSVSCMCLLSLLKLRLFLTLFCSFDIVSYYLVALLQHFYVMNITYPCTHVPLCILFLAHAFLSALSFEHLSYFLIIPMYFWSMYLSHCSLFVTLATHFNIFLVLSEENFHYELNLRNWKGKEGKGGIVHNHARFAVLSCTITRDPRTIAHNRARSADYRA